MLPNHHINLSCATQPITSDGNSVSLLSNETMIVSTVFNVMAPPPILNHNINNDEIQNDNNQIMIISSHNSSPTASPNNHQRRSRSSSQQQQQRERLIHVIDEALSIAYRQRE